MSTTTIDNKIAPLLGLGNYYNRLALVSDVLHYMAHDDLDISTSAILGMPDILNEVAQSIKAIEGGRVDHE